MFSHKSKLSLQILIRDIFTLVFRDLLLICRKVAKQTQENRESEKNTIDFC